MKRITPASSLFIVLCLVLITACDKVAPTFSKQPGDVVKTFYSAANEGKYSEVEEMISDNAKNILTGTIGQMTGGLKGFCDKSTRNGTLTKVEITKEDVRGEGATVFAKLVFKDGSSDNNDKTFLIKQNGAWKVNLEN